MHFHTRLKGIFHSLSLLLVLAASATAAVPDGPYVLKGPGGWEALSVQVAGEVASKQTRVVRVGDTLTIAAVGMAPPLPAARARRATQALAATLTAEWATPSVRAACASAPELPA